MSWKDAEQRYAADAPRQIFCWAGDDSADSCTWPTEGGVCRPSSGWWRFAEAPGSGCCECPAGDELPCYLRPTRCRVKRPLKALVSLGPVDAAVAAGGQMSNAAGTLGVWLTSTMPQRSQDWMKENPREDTFCRRRTQDEWSMEMNGRSSVQDRLFSGPRGGDCGSGNSLVVEKISVTSISGSYTAAIILRWGLAVWRSGEDLTGNLDQTWVTVRSLWRNT
eukprot:767280-Hanusia_phi.AAC.3